MTHETFSPTPDLRSAPLPTEKTLRMRRTCPTRPTGSPRSTCGSCGWCSRATTEPPVTDPTPAPHWGDGCTTVVDEQVVPRLTDRGLNDATAGSWRTTVCGGATGEVLEIGFGSGRNLAYYPAAVTRVLAVEPADLSWQRAQPRVTASGMPVERVGLDGADLPVPDASVDTVVSTWTMCTVRRSRAPSREARRVLRPGGTLRFVEHSLAADERTARRQRRIQPFWGPVAGGCHVDRDIAGLVAGAGFDVDLSYAGFIGGGPAKPWLWFVSGAATPV